jgi:hypothetical protein
LERFERARRERGEPLGNEILQPRRQWQLLGVRRVVPPL